MYYNRMPGFPPFFGPVHVVYMYPKDLHVNVQEELSFCEQLP